MSVASGFFLGAMSLFSDYHVSLSNLDSPLINQDRQTAIPFIIKYSNPKIDGETTYGNGCSSALKTKRPGYTN